MLGLAVATGGGMPPAPAFAQEAAAASSWWVNLGITVPTLDIVELADETLLALTADGAVWRKAPGKPWRRTTLPTWAFAGGGEGPSEEDLLLEAESALGEEADTEVTDAEEVESDDPEAEVEPVEVTEVDAGDIVDRGTLRQDDGMGGAVELPAGGLWVIPGDPQQVITSGPDGSWLSEDGGLSWRALSSLPPTHELVSVPGERVVTVAATAEGLRHNVRGSRSWFTVSGPLDAVEVRGLAEGDGIFYAGTADGLFWSGDGLRWAACVGGADLDVRAIAADPAFPGGLWVVTPAAILRSDDRGATFRRISRNPLAGTRGLLALPEAGHLLAIGEDGLWESQDGGVRWSPRVRGLGSPDQRAVVLGHEGLLIAGAGGVYGLADEAPLPTAARKASTERLPPVQEVVGAALRRNGVSVEPLLLQRAYLRSLYTPRLAIDGLYQRRETLSADYVALQNTRAEQVVWATRLTLCFGACVSNSATTETDDGALIDDPTLDVDAITENADLVMVGGEVYSAGDGDYSALAANVANEVSRYRNAIAQEVTELYFSRIRLTMERGAAQEAPLSQQIEQELELQLTTARLDALTHGYFSRALAGQNSETP